MQEAEVKLSKGDWVFHPRMPDWGYGKILEMIGDNKGRVFFLLAGEKKLSWEHAGLGLVQSDKVSQTALNDQLIEFKQKLAIDLLSDELSREVTCTPCDSFNSRCELCHCSSESLRLYSLAQRGKMCLCDMCRDKIVLEAKERAALNPSPVNTEKKGKKDSDGKEKKKRKLKKDSTLIT
jgi:hypothetical protein